MLREHEIVNKCYILREQIGEDTFSEWWRASAIFVASNFLLRFVKDRYTENEILSKAFLELARKHISTVSPAILSLIEMDRHKRRFFIASEYDGHTSLRAILDSGKRFSVEHTCRLVIELAEGAGTFHLRNEAYGVLTPESVVVHGGKDSIDEIKLMPPSYELFFNAITEGSVEDYRQTWGYASPEFKQGKPGTQKSDIYSLGVILFRMLTGKLPYGSRAGILVRTRSAAPAHVAAALARRGIPRELTTTTVRALRKNPEQRHTDIMVFINELRSILDVRREAWIQAGKVDPIADLATLNLKKARADVHEIVRSLETVNYFRYLGAAGSTADVSPIETMEVDEEIIELEELEAFQTEDDESISTDTYVDEGYKLAEASLASQVSSPQARSSTHSPEKAEQDFLADNTTPIPSSSIQTPFVKPSTVAFNAASSLEPSQDTITPEYNKKRRLKKNSNAQVYWRHSGGSPHEVAEQLKKAVSLAAQGTGVVRFIQEPDSGEAALIIAEALRSMHSITFMVDLGTLQAGATIDYVLERFSQGSGLRLAPKRIVNKARATERRSLTRATRGLANKAANEAISLASNDKPLVVIAHGADSISPSAHRLIVELANRAVHAPFCAFLFFNDGFIPEWHVLSRLKTSTAE